MNICTSDAGMISHKDILANGFQVDQEEIHSDMGQGTYVMRDYSKNDKLFLTGGYWWWYIKDKSGKVLFEGWWNTKEEFDNTIREIETSLEENRQPN